MQAIGGVIKAVGFAVFAISGLWGFFLCLGIISDVAGFWGLVVSLFITPVTFLAAPLYAGFAWDNWFPLILNYGGGIAATVLVGIGSSISGE
ncbi:hypothetical protein SADO_07252 [Salinisphaera dokdonensis CL-ES53]|uniref:Uncharacterized protein n=1 Tax=Salinisphaera dokdonensis CL-ES53 TaxID=1304272 RepID=A0ABV2B0W9_9GAMM